MLARRSQPNRKRARLDDAPPISISMLLEAHVPANRLLMAAAEAHYVVNTGSLATPMGVAKVGSHYPSNYVNMNVFSLLLFPIV